MSLVGEGHARQRKMSELLHDHNKDTIGGKNEVRKQKTKSKLITKVQSLNNTSFQGNLWFLVTNK